MEQTNFSTSFLTDNTPAEVFDAIINVGGWWSGEVTGESNKAGDEFTYEVPGVHYSKQKVTEFVPGKKLVWHVTDANLSFTKNQKEWKGTDIIFDIDEKDGKTQLRFTHKGLVPQYECYNDCSNAWQMLVNGNLANFAATGVEQPSPW